MTLTTFKGKNFKMLISRKRWELAQNVDYDFYIFTFASNGFIALLKTVRAK